MSYIFYILSAIPYGLDMIGKCHKNIKNDLISFFICIERERVGFMEIISRNKLYMFISFVTSRSYLSH